MTESAILPQVERTKTIPPIPRWLSIDVLRGLTIGFMIMVNNNGGGKDAYWAMKHTAWNGFTPTDLVFPTFLFVVGISTVFSTEARLAKGATRKSLLLHTFRRAVILFLLGLLVNSFPLFHRHTLRIYGVLPRIALCYFLVAIFYLTRPSWKTIAALAAAALVGYWAIMRFIPVPGYGVPTHGVPLLDQSGNLTAWLDRQIFPASHLYERTRDPEGLLSTLPAVATTLIGCITGLWLRNRVPHDRQGAAEPIVGSVSSAAPVLPVEPSSRPDVVPVQPKEASSRPDPERAERVEGLRMTP